MARDNTLIVIPFPQYTKSLRNSWFFVVDRFLWGHKMRIVFIGIGMGLLNQTCPKGVGKCPDVSHHPTIGDIR
jgi:hypothetical protein